jgi:hypothetical protein
LRSRPERFFFLLVLAMATLIFFSTVHLKREGFGEVSIANPVDWSSLTALAAVASGNWHRFGPAEDGFKINLSPISIENRGSCSCYRSYPPGFLVPPYLLGRLSGREPKLTMLMGLSGVVQWITVVLLAVGIFFVAIRNEIAPLPAAALATLASGVSSYSMASLLFFQRIWWPDLVGLAFFLAGVVLETLRRSRGGGLKWDVAVGLCIGLGIFVDWLSLFLLLFVLLGRALSREGRSIANLACLIIPAGLSLTLFAWINFFENGEVTAFEVRGLIFKILERTGFQNAGEVPPLGFVFSLWDEAHRVFYPAGMVFLVMIPALLISPFLLSSKRKEAANSFFPLLILPCALHSLVFQQHYYHHGYNLLRFVFAETAALFGAAIAAMLWLRRRFPSRQRHQECIVLLALAAWTGHFGLSNWSHYQDLLAAKEGAEGSSYAVFVREHTSYEHVVFSDELTVDPDHPELSQLTAYSQKFVYPAKTPSDATRRIIEMARYSRGRVRGLKMLYLSRAGTEPPSAWRGAFSGILAEDGRYVLYEIEAGPLLGD